MTTCDPGAQPVRTANEFCRDVACARERLRRSLVEAGRRWSETVAGSDPCAPTLRPQAVNEQVSGASSDTGSDGQGFAEVWPAHSDEWRKLAAGWGFGGICNAVDELAKRDPASAPRYVIEAARLLRFVAEDLGLDGAHPLGSETWRSEP